MPIPRRPKRPPQAPPKKPQVDDLPADEDVLDSADDWMTTGTDADKRINDYQKEASRPRAREFFITQAEVTKAGGRCTVRVHCAFNYANADFRVAIPRITVKEGARFNSYTSKAGDCALAAGGLRPSIRPVFVLIDHRTYEKQDGSAGGDDVRLWIPMPSVQGLMDSAIDDLAETLGEDRDDIDLTQYEAKITKAGTGRRSTWAISFIAKPRPLSSDIQEKIKKFCGVEHTPTLRDYRKKLAELLAPEPRFLLSQGAKPYVEQKTPEDAGQASGRTPFDDDGD